MPVDFPCNPRARKKPNAGQNGGKSHSLMCDSACRLLCLGPPQPGSHSFGLPEPESPVCVAYLAFIANDRPLPILNGREGEITRERREREEEERGKG